MALRLLSASRIRSEIFGGGTGVCVVHGDTPSTLLATLLARRAGLSVAHLEAGLRSGSLLHPFPEEAIRRIVMRLSATLFAPDREAIANLRAMKVRGHVVALAGNTSADAVGADVRGADPSGPAVVTMHRVENLHRPAVVKQLVEVVESLAQDRSVRFVVHGPTWPALQAGGYDQRLRDAGVDLVDLMPHGKFVSMLAAAPLVITDGGSIQEECALLGVPTLLWRRRTERSDGLGRNVVLSNLDARVIDDFLANPQLHRAEVAGMLETSPSDQIVDELIGLVDDQGRGAPTCGPTGDS